MKPLHRNILAACLATCSLAPPADAAWVVENAQQAYVNLGCGTDAGAVLLSINTGTRKYVVTSKSDLFKASWSIATRAVAYGRKIETYALSGFPMVTRFYRNDNGNCSSMTGIDLLGISIDASSSPVSVRPAETPTEGWTVSRTAREIVVQGADGPVDIVSVRGEILVRLHPDAAGAARRPLSTLPSGMLYVRSGTRSVALANF